MIPPQTPAPTPRPPHTHTPPTPLAHTAKLTRKCKPQTSLSEIIAARLPKFSTITLGARKSYISRGPSALAQLNSKSRRDVVKTSLFSATCDSTIDENQVAAIATFSPFTKRQEDLDDEIPRKSSTTSSIDASPTSRRKSRKASEAYPRTPREKTLKTPDESPRTYGKSSSSHSKKKSKSSQGDCATQAVIKNRKKVSSSPSEKRTCSKKCLAQNASTDDINWLNADPIDVSNSDWAMLDVGSLVNASIGSHKKSAGSMDDTSSDNFSDEDSWLKLSMMGLDDSLHKKPPFR